jgi:phage baseplate assembly protein W
MVKSVYRGYSSFEFDREKTFRLRDIETVKMDLLNHIWTKRGERVMHADFGTIIPELVFEPLDDALMETVRDELTRVIDYDPRVQLNDMTMEPNYDGNSLTVIISLLYVEFGITDVFTLNLDFHEQDING